MQEEREERRTEWYAVLLKQMRKNMGSECDLVYQYGVKENLIAHIFTPILYSIKISKSSFFLKNIKFNSNRQEIEFCFFVMVFNDVCQKNCRILVHRGNCLKGRLFCMKAIFGTKDK